MSAGRRSGDTGEFQTPGRAQKAGKSGVGRALRPQADPRQKRKFKEFRLTSFAIDHPTSVFVMTLIVVLLGLSSYVNVPKEMMPEIVMQKILFRMSCSIFLIGLMCPFQ